MIEYTITKRKNLAIGAEQYYPKIVRSKTVDTEYVADLLASRTTLSKAEVYSFLDALARGIAENICQSKVVEVEGLGIFTPSIKAKSVLTQEEVTTDTITHKGVNYRPTSKMKDKFSDIKFSKANLDVKHL